jgi:hypothetical protein
VEPRPPRTRRRARSARLSCAEGSRWPYRFIVMPMSEWPSCSLTASGWAFCAMKSGISERLVQLAEQMGEMLAPFITGVLDDLKLTPEQKRRAPEIVRTRLTALEGRRPVDTVALVREG